MSMKVTIFGASSCSEEEYNNAVSLGSKLAAEGYTIVNGGYCGTMEATAKGAKENGGNAIGIIVPTVLIHRDPEGNQYLTSNIKEKTLNDRINKLIEIGDAYIILPGSLGTLNEFLYVMTTIYISSDSNTQKKPVIAFSKPWKDIWNTSAKELNIPESVSKNIIFVDTVRSLIFS
ncbi:hypothetical protein WA158_006257 [Blastocystis sp. Blastoise]